MLMSSLHLLPLVLVQQPQQEEQQQLLLELQGPVLQ
jgi:hypothetical protein